MSKNRGSHLRPTRSVQNGEPDLSWVDVLLEDADTVAWQIGLCRGEDTKVLSRTGRSAQFCSGGSPLVFSQSEIWVFMEESKHAGNP